MSEFVKTKTPEQCMSYHQKKYRKFIEQMNFHA